MPRIIPASFCLDIVRPSIGDHTGWVGFFSSTILDAPAAVDFIGDHFGLPFKIAFESSTGAILFDGGNRDGLLPLILLDEAKRLGVVLLSPGTPENFDVVNGKPVVLADLTGLDCSAFVEVTEGAHGLACWSFGKLGDLTANGFDGTVLLEGTQEGFALASPILEPVVVFNVGIGD